MISQSPGSMWSTKRIILMVIGVSLIAGVCAAQTDDAAGDAEISPAAGTVCSLPCFTVLYDFGPGNTTGGSPDGRLLRDSADNLYGTAAGGGANNFGVVFKLSPTHLETVLYNFQGKLAGDGSNPIGGLVQDSAGNLYGTTYAGGTYDYGTVFKLTPAGVETVLHSFAGVPDGAFPRGELLLDFAGNLYGTTSRGGTGCSTYAPPGCGTVFTLSAAGVETVLHRFKNSPDGAFPTAGLIKDAKGNLYGTTGGGGNVFAGSALGTVFRVSPGGTETVLYRFKGYPSDGQNPNATLVWDASGNLYGTAIEGGPKGWGTVFKLSPLGKETTLYSFPGNATDGRSPEAGLVRDSAGNLYGTTLLGGRMSQCINEGCGIAFKISPTGAETVLHRFSETANDGCSPTAAVIRGPAGNLYGATPNCGSPSFSGSLFKIVP